MENFSKYTPLAIHEREMVLLRVIGIERMRERWAEIKYSPYSKNDQLTLIF